MDEERRDEIEEKNEEKEEKKSPVVHNHEKKKNWLSSVSEKNNRLEKVRGNPWIVSTFVLGAVVLVGLIINLGGMTGGFITGGAISESDIGTDALNFFNTQLNSAGGGTLDSVNSISGIYQVMIDYNGNSVPLYFTKDGNFIYPGNPLISIYDSEEPTPTEIPKTETPTVDLYVMSFCPYGNQAEDTMLPVYNLLKDKVDWSVHYIVSVSGDTVNSLHGQPEVDEDMREACVLQDYGMDTLWTFMTDVNENCGSDGSCWESAAAASGIDTSKIESCVSENGLDLMKAEAQASSDAGATGSPTLIINGVETTAVYQYGNSEAYKEAICSAFETAPEECSTQLSGSTTTSTGGSC